MSTWSSDIHGTSLRLCDVVHSRSHCYIKRTVSYTERTIQADLQNAPPSGSVKSSQTGLFDGQISLITSPNMQQVTPTFPSDVVQHWQTWFGWQGALFTPHVRPRFNKRGGAAKAAANKTQIVIWKRCIWIWVCNQPSRAKSFIEVHPCLPRHWTWEGYACKRINQAHMLWNPMEILKLVVSIDACQPSMLQQQLK